jgi:type IV pilus assembly protein PilV
MTSDARFHNKPSRVGGAFQRGELLIEVLIAVLLMSVGLLGIAAMQAGALRNSQSALQRGQAATQIHAILDAMRANRTNALAGSYALSRTCSVPSGSGLAGTDLSTWMTGLQETLGSTACGTVSCTSTVCTVVVDWDDSRASDAGTKDSKAVVASGDSAYTLTVSARL